MPNPCLLKIGDIVRFVSIPEEWGRPGYTVHKESIAFMKAMIRRSRPSRVARLDEYGRPWIEARLRHRGKLQYHSWMIAEETGWRLVKRRSQNPKPDAAE